MAKVKNVLMAGLLALVSAFSIGMFAACGSEADNDEKIAPVQETVKLVDAVVECEGLQGKVSTFMSDNDSILSDGHNRNFEVQVLVNDKEVKSFETVYGDEMKDELAKIELVLKSGDTIVINYIYDHYLTNFTGNFWGKHNVALSKGDLDKAVSYTLVVA